ncbi:MAG: ABC transporter ATP-binding protein [Solirubrobacterales bacterium]
MAEPAIQVDALRKDYGDVQAVRGIDLTVSEGEVFAFLGPNGAGKTTTVEILEGYRRRSAGDVRVLGVDPEEADRAWRSRIGIVLQECQLQRQLTVRESLELYAGYYPRPRPVDETVALIGLHDKQDARVRTLSGGQVRRLDVGLALIGNPDLIFLDEPTTGFDPEARQQAWEVIRSLRELGKTVFITTHYMDEAQALADRVAIIAAGTIVAEGSPATVGDRDRAATTIAFRVANGARPDELAARVDGALTVDGGAVALQTREPVADLHALTDWAIQGAHELSELTVSRPSLEDVYLDLVRDR